jgi:hypothetical protein
MELLNRADAAAKTAILGTTLANARVDIAQVECSGIAHCRDHGDYRTIVALLNACAPGGIRAQGIAAHARHFTSGKLSLQYDSKTKLWGGKLAKDRKPEDFKVDEAMLVDFVDFTKEKNPKPFDLKALVGMLKAKADSNDDAKVTPAARQASSKLLAFMQAEGLAPTL